MAAKTIPLKLFITTALVVMGLEYGWIFLVPKTTGYTGLGILRILQIAFTLGIVFFFERQLTPVGLAPGTILQGIRKGALWSAAFGLAAGIVFFLLWAHGTPPHRLLHVRLPQETHTKILFFTVGGLIAPLAEEVFFRGILFGFFRQWGFGAALFISTLLFAVAHPGVSYVQVTGGILFAISYEKENNLLVPIVIHTLGNCALFSLSLFP